MFHLPGKQWTLRQQLIGLLVIFAIGPLLVTNTRGYLQTRRVLEETELENVHNIASLEANAVFRFVREQYQYVRAIVAGNQHLFGLIRGLRTPDVAARASILRALRKHLLAKQKNSPAIKEFYLLSPKGRLIVSSLEHPGHQGDQRQSPCFRRGTQVAAIDGVDWHSPEPMLMLSAPITDGAGTFLGVFCGRTRVLLGRSQTTRVVGRSSPTALYLVDHRGRIVASDTHAARAGGSQVFNPLPQSSWTYGSESWQGRFSTPGGEVLAAYAPEIEMGWGVLVTTPVNAAMASLEVLKWQGLAFAAVLAALLVFAVVIVARRIARPLVAVSDAAGRAAQGAFGVHVPTGGTVEVRNLARAFNVMSTAIKESHDLLEHRINERTQALQSSQEFSERLLDSIAQPVLVVNRERRIVKANSAAIARYGEEIIDSGYHERFEADDASSHDCAVCGTFETGRAATTQVIEPGEPDSAIILLHTFPVVSPQGVVEAVIQMRREVTDERHLQAQLVHQEKMSAFGIMAAGVAHEIGNPLAAVQSQLLLAREAPTPGRVEETLTIVSHEVERIAGLLRDLVSFARHHDTPPMLVDVAKVATEVVRLIRHDPRARHVTIDVVDHDAAPVRCQEAGLSQVLINLGLNAMDAMPTGGELRFEVSVEGDRTLLRVCDTGDGIPQAAKPHLFEPFYTTKAPGHGTGLGLFVSLGIVKGFGGELSVESSSAAGTIFCVSLPAEQGSFAGPMRHRDRAPELS